MTCSAPMRSKGKAGRWCSAFTLTELIIVVVIVSLFLLLALPNVFALLTKNTFKAQIQDFVSTMQMAARAAAESNRRYEVVIDLTEQSYLLREITSPDLSEVLEEEIIVENDFGDTCQVSYVLFDDVDFSLDESVSYTNEGKAMFRAGHAGWHYGGKIVLLDRDGKSYSVIVNRINRMVTLQEGDIEILKPRAFDDVVF
ncbi:MAG TPA: type II secretion system protein [Sedimentisphaerales bacterium]|nr:type II secretion system protein [Sedimentisphaerales bacterium]